jgi:hypothetical protein
MYSHVILCMKVNVEYLSQYMYCEPRIKGHRWDKHFGVLISEGPSKQPRITKNNFGRDMLWGVPISECSYIGGPYIRGSL